MSPANLHPLPKAHLEAIGCVVTLWSTLEEIAEECLLYAASLDTGAVGHAVTSQMGINQRLDALLSLVHLTKPDSDLEVELQKIDKEIRKEREGTPPIQTERNKVVHGYWETRDKEVMFSKISAKRRLKVAHTSISVEEIEAIAERIAQAVEKFESWEFRFLASLAETEEANAQ
jgi:hypothetical protein